MLAELKSIVEHCTRTPPRLDALREAFGPPWVGATPSDVLDFAKAYCRLALPLVRDPDGSPSLQGAGALVRFIANFPADLEAAIRAVPAFGAAVKRASEEPFSDPYVSLCCTVHDVWAHLIGPESEEDPAILAELLRHGAERAVDFGAGAGHFAIALAGHGVEVDAFEIDVVKRTFLAFRSAAAGLSRKIHVGLKDGPCDMALCINVLDHLENPAAIVDAMASRLDPGGILWVLAAFPEDGWHQSDRDVVDRCADALWTQFVPESRVTAHVPWLTAFVRRGDGESTAASLESTPCVCAGSTLHAGANDAELVLAASNFYARDCTLNSDAAEVCRQLDGSRSVAQLALAIEIDADELLLFCTYLHQQRHLYWRRSTDGVHETDEIREEAPC